MSVNGCGIYYLLVGNLEEAAPGHSGFYKSYVSAAC